MQRRCRLAPGDVFRVLPRHVWHCCAHSHILPAKYEGLEVAFPAVDDDPYRLVNRLPGAVAVHPHVPAAGVRVYEL